MCRKSSRQATLGRFLCQIYTAVTDIYRRFCGIYYVRLFSYLQGKSMRIHHVFIVLLLLVSPQGYAYDLQRSMDNLAEDVSTCVAFYTVVTVYAKQNAERMNDAKGREVAKMYEPTLSRALDLLRLTMPGKAESFVQSKIDLRMQGSLKTLQTEGIDRLLYLHADSCKALMENPDLRLKYWKEKQ